LQCLQTIEIGQLLSQNAGPLWIYRRSIRRFFLELLRGSSGRPSIKSKLLGQDPARRLFKSVATIFWVCVIHAALSLLNVLLLECLLSVGDINWRAVRLLTLEQEMEQEMVLIRHQLISGSMLRNFTQPNRIHAERKGDPLGTHWPSALHHRRRSGPDVQPRSWRPSTANPLTAQR
jgi:hypothetical protein